MTKKILAVVLTITLPIWIIPVGALTMLYVTYKDILADLNGEVRPYDY